MTRLLQMRSFPLSRSLSSSRSPHIIDGISHPRSPPASRSSNPCSLRSADGPAPIWLPTHSVFNQAAPLHNFDSYSSDRALVECFAALQATFPAQMSDGSLQASVARFAQAASSQFIHEHAFAAHSSPPVFSSHDRTGIRRDQIEYHPSYHQLMAFGIENRVPSLSFANKGTSAAMVSRSSAAGGVFLLMSRDYMSQVSAAVFVLPSGAGCELPSHHDLRRG